MPTTTFSFIKSFALALCASSLLIACGTDANTDALDAKVMNTRRGLSLAQWFSKQGLTAQEIKTVDAILNYISLTGGPSGNPETVARYAERSMDILSLDSLGLNEVGPILQLKSLSHISLSGNAFSQSQIEELITGLPKLRTIVVDANIQCRNDLNPKVKCLK